MEAVYLTDYRKSSNQDTCPTTSITSSGVDLCSGQHESLAFYTYGLVNYIEYTAPLDPTATPSAAPTPSSPATAMPTSSGSASKEWLVISYYSDSACTQYAGEQGVVMNACYPSSSTGQYVYGSYHLQDSVYTVTYSYYSDAACTQYVSSEIYAPPTRCNINGQFDGDMKVVSDIPTSFPVEGTYFAMYESAEDCTAFGASNASLYIFLAYDSNICLPAFSDEYFGAVSADAYKWATTPSYCLKDEAKPLFFEQCDGQVQSTSPLYYGYVNYNQGVGGGGSSGDGDTTTIIIIAVTVSVGAVVIIAAVAAWYFFYFAKADPLLRGTTDVPLSNPSSNA